MSLVKQREVGSDTLSFNEGLRNILRQDPNVIFVGELRDMEAVNLAITAAETGHLVLTTMHTTDTVGCINRLVDFFPAEQHNQVRSRLSQCLEGIMSQVLLPLKDNPGRVVATEMLIATHTLRKLIREGQHDQSMNYEEAGLRLGMHMLDESLKDLVKKELVDQVVATGFAKNPDQFKRELVRI
jgi:twitching motility protein PilT